MPVDEFVDELSWLWGLSALGALGCSPFSPLGNPGLPGGLCTTHERRVSTVDWCDGRRHVMV